MRFLISAHCKLGFVEVVDLLLAAGADVNRRAKGGVTACHIATGMGFESILTKLIASGADVNAVDDEQKSPLAIAKEMNQDNLVSILLGAGATPLPDDAVSSMLEDAVANEHNKSEL